MCKFIVNTKHNSAYFLFMVLLAGVSGEEDPRAGPRAALRHEGPEESNTER